ncbi:cardiotrophin-like cytokine factor 1 [Vanacampus margaritifer]
MTAGVISGAVKSFKPLKYVHQIHLVFLLAASAPATAGSSHTLANERSSIESTYELTKFLEYQLKEIKDVYLTYLGPPFNDKDFSPPRPNSTALTLPSAATRLELWHGLENQARLAQNQRAYSVLLAAVRELARSTLCPSLKTSLLHFCTGLDGLLGSISALMTTLGYALPEKKPGDLQRTAGGDGPVPLISSGSYRSRTRERTGRRSQGEREGGVNVDVKRGKARRRLEADGGRSDGSREKVRGERRRGRREEPEAWKWDWEEEERAVGTRRWGRSLLSVGEDAEAGEGFSYNLQILHTDTLRKEDGVIVDGGKSFFVDFSSPHHQRRPPRSLLPPTLHPPPSTLSLLYQPGPGEEHGLVPTAPALSLHGGPSLLSSSSSSSAVLLSVRPAMSDFARKVEGFWILRELQSWLWRSAKDFNRLKRRLRG